VKIDVVIAHPHLLVHAASEQFLTNTSYFKWLLLTEPTLQTAPDGLFQVALIDRTNSTNGPCWYEPFASRPHANKREHVMEPFTQV
jgi:hypothetical protein